MTKVKHSLQALVRKPGAIPRATALLIAAAVFAAQAQGVLEVIQLKHRPADQLIPILLPLMESGGALSGQHFQLIVRTSPRNLADIKQALAAIDAPARRLEISVRFESAIETAVAGAQASGAARSGGASTGDRARIDVRVHDSRSSRDERVDQRVQVLDGGRAFIASGESRPLRQREVIQTPHGTVVRDSTVMHDAATGFEVVPRVSGENVLLEIRPQRQTFESPAGGGRPGAMHSQQASTSVSARLGEWFELGGASGGEVRDQRGILSTAQLRSSESRRIWVRVEEIRP